MKILIIESNEAKIDRNYKTTSMVHVRNSVVIAEHFGADLISVETEIPDVINNKYDVIVCVYASGYQMYNKYLQILLNNREAKIYWMTNEYSVPDNILLRKFVQECDIGFDMIANLERDGYKKSLLNLLINGVKLNDWILNWYCVNLNALIYDKSFLRQVPNTLFGNEKTDCVYYSTFRPDRNNDLKDYNGARYAISTSTKNVFEFKKAGIVAEFGDKISWEKGKETLFTFKYSIYLEDTHTHTHYNHIANRFYECLMLDVLLFFDHRCRNTIEKSEYIVDEFMIVSNGKELNEKMVQIDSDNELYFKLLDIQRQNCEIAEREKVEVLEKIGKIFEIEKTQVKGDDFERQEKKRVVKIKQEDEEEELQLRMNLE